MRSEKDKMPDELHLVRDVLDKLLVAGEEHDPLGRADGVVLVVESGVARVARIELGAPTLAARLSDRLGQWVRRLGARYGLHGGKPVRISFSKVQSIGIELVINTDPDRSRALAWERWICEHITRHIPVFKRK
jgi:hypothetical protein